MIAALHRLINEWIEALRIAGEQLVTHKMRSLLTALGVIIGIIAVTMMGTAIKGIDQGFDDSLDMIGRDLLYVERWPWRDVGDDWVKYRNRPHIETAAAAEINEWIAQNPDSLLRLAVPTGGTTRSVSRDDMSASGVQIVGTNGDFGLINTSDLLHGRFFTGGENLSGQNVVILGYDVADALFPEGMDRSLGKEVRINRLKFTVIGVLSRQGAFLGIQSFDQQAIIPLTSLRKFYRGKWRNSIRVQVRPEAPVAWAVDELTGVMRQIRELKPDEENDFEINRSDAIEEQLGPIKLQISIAGFFITGLALFVGAIGIMNITFVSVKERTREIGTRRALGARRKTILLQFLVESVSICLVGGLLGLAAAYGIRAVVANLFPQFPFNFTAGLVALAAILSILTGIVSGIAPAWQAAKLDPANALRHE